ncbi:MAG: nucleotidyltransferase family protein, partial [Candidatus Marinimicrobia bacterium]|nr:nucleotidyltransferase family protein [Candidatus Neomarinimicrobiota bacterium]
NIGAIILAAGSSQRLPGQNKLLLPLKGQPMIMHSLSAARTAGLHPVVTVLGYEAQTLLPLLNDPQIIVVTNDGWVNGMGSSISAGITALPAALSGVAILLADMPLIGAPLLERLAAEFSRQGLDKIIAPCYNKQRGNPVIFPRKYFDELLALDGETGGRKIILRHETEVVLVSVTDSAVLKDCDTRADYSALDGGTGNTLEAE